MRRLINGKKRDMVWNKNAFAGKPYKSDIGTVRFPKVGGWVLSAQAACDIMFERDGMK